MIKAERLALGSAQFGLAYGIANRHGKVAPEDVEKILAFAKMSGIDTIDSAMAYGNAESVLGANGLAQWRIVSKLDGVPNDCADIEGFVFGKVRASLARLGIVRLHGLMLHRPAQLGGEQGRAIFAGLQRVKQAGLAERIGYSIYDPEELDLYVEAFPPDIVQAPLNVFDRRLATSGWLKKLSQSGVEIHVRSIFLQGLLLMAPEERRERFRRFDGHWQIWDRWLASNGFSAQAAALSYVCSFAEIDRIVVGVETVGQLREIIGALANEVHGLPASLATNDKGLINPSQWGEL